MSIASAGASTFVILSRIVATAIEFWQGQPNRLHDRVRYELDGDAWQRERLGP